MVENKQSWFLIKSDWRTFLEKMTYEEVGKFIMAIYTGEIPEGMLGMLILSHMEEFERVNAKRVEILEKNREKAKRGAEKRWSKPVLDDNKPSIAELSPTIPELSPTIPELSPAINKDSQAIANDSRQIQGQEQEHIQKQIQVQEQIKGIVKLKDISSTDNPVITEPIDFLEYHFPNKELIKSFPLSKQKYDYSDDEYISSVRKHIPNMREYLDNLDKINEYHISNKFRIFRNQLKSNNTLKTQESWKQY